MERGVPAIVLRSTRDQDIWLTSTLGRNYEASKDGGLRAVLNFQWNVGKPVVEPPSELVRSQKT